ncbi:MAG: hypothetical protein DRQ10_01115 [Candidatus Hydrothermota bacterium]|nr:MAG: hypothetical protein DRQ10_01115 [Candidatus Hydrothermae bacterium]
MTMLSILLPLLIATTYHTIEIDGDISDFAADELIIDDSDNDSRWGTLNEIYGIYFTWDAENLYIGADYIVQNNALLILLDIGDAEGDYNINDLDWYPRNFSFRGMKPRVLVAIWNSEQWTSCVRKIVSNGQTEPINGATIVVDTSAGGVRNGIEASIPINELFENGQLTPGSCVKLVALIAGGDHATGGDAAPDNELIGTPNVISRFAVVELDANADGLLDADVSPNEVTEIVEVPHVNFEVTDFTIEPRVAAQKGDSVHISFKVSDNADGYLRIYDENGRKIREFWFSLGADEEFSVGFETDGLQPGIYFVEVNTGNYVAKKAFAIVAGGRIRLFNEPHPKISSKRRAIR